MIKLLICRYPLKIDEWIWQYANWHGYLTSYGNDNGNGLFGTRTTCKVRRMVGGVVVSLSNELRGVSLSHINANANWHLTTYSNINGNGLFGTRTTCKVIRSIGKINHHPIHTYHTPMGVTLTHKC